MIVIRQNSTWGLHMCVWSGNIRSIKLYEEREI